MIHTLLLSDALSQLPTHESRLAAAAEIEQLTGFFPWGVADESRGDRADFSAAVLVASLHRARAGQPALRDLCGEWEQLLRLSQWMRNPIGPTMHIAAVFSRTLGDGAGWLVITGFGTKPAQGPEHSEAGRAAADHDLMFNRSVAVLDGESIRYAA